MHSAKFYDNFTTAKMSPLFVFLGLLLHDLTVQFFCCFSDKKLFFHFEVICLLRHGFPEKKSCLRDPKGLYIASITSLLIIFISGRVSALGIVGVTGHLYTQPAQNVYHW